MICGCVIQKWLYICTQITATKRLSLKPNIMNATFYIWNTKTDESFDTNEMKFYSASWEVELEEKSYLETVMANYPEKFENCVIVNKSE